MSRALEGQRDFSIMIPSYQGAWQGAGTGWTTKGDKSLATPLHGNGWTADGDNTIIYEGYIDLSALQLDDLTMFPLEVGLQDPGFYTESDGTMEMIVMDIMSQDRLSQSTMSNFMTRTLNQFNNAPGLGGTSQDYHMITMGNLRMMYKSNLVSTSSTLIPFTTIYQSPFGSGAPVAVEKLWCYRFVYYPAKVAGETMEIPASRFILKGLVDKEPRYVYINRLKNSYELQQSG